VEGWIREVDLQRQGDRQALRLHLVPEHLGPLHVELSREAAGLHARITVAHAETMALIQRHLEDLRQALQAQGYPLARLDVGFGAGEHPGRGRREAGELGTGAGSSRVVGLSGPRERASAEAMGAAGGAPAWGPGNATVLDIRI